jgi:hypothetical protein
MVTTVLPSGMFGSRLAPPAQSVRIHSSSALCGLCVSALSSLPFQRHLQQPENKTTSGPAVAILDAASSLTPLFATLTKNTRGGGYRFCPLSFMASSTSHHSLPTISFTIRTSEKRARNSRRIRTSKTQDLKPFRMNTYRKTREGGAVFQAKNLSCRFGRCRYVVTSLLPYFLTSLPRFSSHGTNVLLPRLHRCRGEIHA